MTSPTETSHPTPPVSPADIEAAAKLIQPRLRRTPVLVDDNIVYKLELLQHSGTFKARGATHALTRAAIDERVGDAGVVAASGGNHGAAVAWAAKELGIPANIFVPTISAETKVDRLRLRSRRSIRWERSTPSPWKPASSSSKPTGASACTPTRTLM